MLSVQAQMEVLCRGVVDLHVREELEARLLENRPLRVKAGFDPTRPDLHLGHTVLMEKMRQFQELGHEVVFLIGDFTALVGDPTGRNEARPALGREEVREAAKSYQAQAFKILDEKRTVVRYNSEWLERDLDAIGMLKLAGSYTVARMLERDDFGKRFAAGRPIHVHEFLYPLLQAYDSVALECDIELGGTDQLFNLLVGRDIMPRYGKRAQLVMTTPLLEGTDARVEDGRIVGAKMSKSAGNYVGIDEAPHVMLNKLMLVDDRLLWRYMDLLSRRPAAEIEALRREVEAGRVAVVQAKESFACEIVSRYHGDAAARPALERRHQVAAGGVPGDAPELTVACAAAEIGLAKALQLAGMTKSFSDALRMIEQGGVYLEGARVTDQKHALSKGGRYLVRVGGKNRRFAYILVR